jgi:hypothetical protein
MANTKPADAALAYAVVIAEAVQEGCTNGRIGALIGVPTGHVYAAMMPVMTLDQFDTIIGALERCGVIRRPQPNTAFDVLEWINTPEASTRLARLRAAARLP